MSRLFYLSFRRDHDSEEEVGSVAGDALHAAFIGTPSQTLGQALNHFIDKAQDFCQRVVDGEVPNVPPVIVENCKKNLLQPVHAIHNFAIKPIKGGYMIWPAEGPDRYVLVD